MRVNRFLSTLLESLQDGILACDAAGTPTFCNEATRKLFGLQSCAFPLSRLCDHCEVFDSTGTVRITGEDLPLRRALKGETVEDLEVVAIPEGQPPRTLIISARAFHDDRGQVLGAVMSMHDVTLRKRAEEELRQARDELDVRVQQRTQELFDANTALKIEAAERERAERQREAAYAQVAATMESITDALVAVDADWRFTYINARAERIYHRSREEMIGRELWQVFPEILGTVFEHEYRRAMRDRVSVQLEALFQPLDAWFSVNIFPMENGGLSFYFQDVTERKRDEAAARENEMRFRAIVEQVKDYAIFTTDTHGRPTSWNEGVRRVLGFEEEEFIGQDITSIIFSPEDQAHGVAQRELHQAATAGSTANDRWLRKKDGTQFFASGVTTASRDSEGRLLGFMKVMRDQTEHKHMEDELRRIAAGLEEADQRKNEFLAMLAHELRNPLAPISNALRILQLSSADTEVVRSACALMERQIRHMVHLVDDLLDVSRITRGKIDLRREVIELSTVIYQAIETSRPSIEANGHELVVSLPAAPVYVRGDSVRLAQVFSNLLNNSSKYSDPGGSIRLTARCKGGDVEVTVKDTGVGIPPPMLPKVFEMFTQVDQSLARSQGGLGIGLTLVQRLVELHDGSVQAFSEGVGRGSEFVVRLPIIVQQPELPRAKNDLELSVPSQRRILVVDDNRDSANTLAMLLRMTGNETRTVHDGVEAVRAASEFRPDLVVLDIGLPRLNGYEVAQLIRQAPWGQRMVLVALTGWGQEEDRKKSKAAGFDAHLVKPLELAALTKLMAELLPAQ
ncbi:MAG: hybrid sensor histidine kinase/response regulator [Aureliella sp.]